MKKHLVWAAILAVAVGSWAIAEDKEKEEGKEVKVTLDQVPAAVKDTLVKEAAGAEIKSVDKETDDGKTIYETDVKSGGKNWEIKVDESGKLISKKEDNEDDEKGEVTIKIDEAPAAVKDAVGKLDGGADVKTIDKESKDGKAIYEVDVKSGGKNWEIKFDENGKQLSKREDNEEDEKKEGGEKGEKKEK